MFLAGQSPTSSLGGGSYAGKRASVSQGNTFGPHDPPLDPTTERSPSIDEILSS
jgi:hypothetical protein